MRQTKLQRMELYKADYEQLVPYNTILQKANSSGTVRGLSGEDLILLANIHNKYYAKDKANLNCGACVYKMVNRLSKLVKKYESDLT